jgi:hypothetical protein
VIVMRRDLPSPSQMCGSGAGIANSRFAYAVWKTERVEAERLAREVGEAAENLI